VMRRLLACEVDMVSGALKSTNPSGSARRTADCCCKTHSASSQQQLKADSACLAVLLWVVVYRAAFSVVVLVLGLEGFGSLVPSLLARPLACCTS
jgi:hypothetical protein